MDLSSPRVYDEEVVPIGRNKNILYAHPFHFFPRNSYFDCYLEDAIYNQKVLTPYLLVVIEDSKVL